MNMTGGYQAVLKAGNRPPRDLYVRLVTLAKGREPEESCEEKNEGIEQYGDEEKAHATKLMTAVNFKLSPAQTAWRLAKVIRLRGAGRSSIEKSGIERSSSTTPITSQHTEACSAV
jgi:hypothetical protein